jgi:hypothetical protein
VALREFPELSVAAGWVSEAVRVHAGCGAQESGSYRIRT